VRQQLKVLLEAAAAQQAESSASRQCSERGRAEAPSTHGPNPPPSQHRERGEGAESLHRHSEAASGPTATCGTLSRPADGPRASTTTTTTARATTTIEDAGGVTTATTTATAAGHQTRGVRGPLAKASETRISPRVSVLRETCLCTTGTPTPAYGSRTPTLLPRWGSDGRPLRHQESAALPQRLRADMTRAPTTGQDPRLDRPTSGLCREFPRHLHAPRQAVGATQLQAAAGGEPA
jgi:hypothetical protein